MITASVGGTGCTLAKSISEGMVEELKIELGAIS